MLVLILRQLRYETARTVLTVLSIAAAVIAEILILEGFLAGLYDQLRSAVLNRGGDLIVTQAGISNFIMARSILPQPIGILLADAIAAVIHTIAPVYLILATEPGAIARTAIACLAFAALGALIPVRAIAHIDPAIVFRS